MEEILCERQESSAQSSAATVEEIQARIKQCLKEDIGRTQCRCKESIHPRANKDVSE
jgi:hypothetical protein